MNTIGAITSNQANYTRSTQLSGDHKRLENQPPTNKNSDDDSVTNTNGSVITKQSPSPTQIPEAERQQIAELTARDVEVRTHEAAHKAAGGSLTGSASFTYQTGPNGKRYAIGGEVSVDTSPVAGDPQATLLKANRIRAAAAAPAQPSAQDNSVAAGASAMASEARAQILVDKQQKHQDKAETNEETAEKPNVASEANTSTTNQNTANESHPINKQAQLAYGTLSINKTETNHGRHIDLIV